ncbi:MAG: hypothetical protein C4B59_00905 [Candidatus Methanogaster sp.]|uniref:Uncharacterized protein n=1 Tax=Candidatus Methanogaster sp. TaxID=3386292 RepID=A0AC61L703_9EURY|nr:MAG: hypothetical protein C4B59_00905 [ANME-2 cluster archaeon]
MIIKLMLYKPCGISGACENGVNFLIAVFYENNDAAQISPLQCERDRDINGYESRAIDPD